MSYIISLAIGCGIGLIVSVAYLVISAICEERYWRKVCNKYGPGLEMFICYRNELT